MKVVFHKDFYQVYTSDAAAEAGRMGAIVEVIGSDVEVVTFEPASREKQTERNRSLRAKTWRKRDCQPIAKMDFVTKPAKVWKGGCKPC